MKIKLIKTAAQILAEQYDVKSPDSIDEATIDTETFDVEFLRKNSDGVNERQFRSIKHCSMIVCSDIAYYKDGSLFGK